MSDVIMYSTPSCPWCHKLKEFLNEKSIQFIDVDISDDMSKAQEMIKKSGEMGVPQIEINDKTIVGFNQEAIERALAL